eukprot:g12703.t1
MPPKVVKRKATTPATGTPGSAKKKKSQDGGSSTKSSRGKYTRIAWAGPKQEIYQLGFNKNTKPELGSEVYKKDKYQINGCSRCVRYLTLGSPAQDHEEAVLLTARLSALQNRQCLPATNQHGKPSGGMKDWLYKFKCPVKNCQFEVTWCKINKQAFAQNYPNLASQSNAALCEEKFGSDFFLETLVMHTCSDAEYEKARADYLSRLDNKRKQKQEAARSQSGVLPKERIINRFQAQLRIVTMYPFVEKLLLADPDMSSDGIATAVSLIFGFTPNDYKAAYSRRVSECINLFQDRYPGLRRKTRRSATRGNPISSRSVIYKEDPNLMPTGKKEHKAFGNFKRKKAKPKTPVKADLDPATKDNMTIEV